MTRQHNCNKIYSSTETRFWIKKSKTREFASLFPTWEIIAFLCAIFYGIPTAWSQRVIMDATRGNGSFETIDPSDAPVQSGPRRAGKGAAEFQIPGWSISNERGFSGIDGQYSASDGQQYLFANRASIVRATSEKLGGVKLKRGDALQFDFQLAGKETGVVVIGLAYHIDGFLWNVERREINIKSVDQFIDQRFLTRLPLDVDSIAVSITVDTKARKISQVRIDNLRLTRIASNELPPLPTELFVATDGNDNDPGTITKPLRTIQKAADIATPGLTVNIRGGVYEEKVTLRSSGVPGYPIIFQPYENEKVTVSTADSVIDWKKAKGDINQDGKPDSNIWVANVNGDTGGKRESNTVFVNGELRFEAKYFAESDPLEFANWGKIKKGDLNFTQLKSDQLKGGKPNFWKGAKVRHHTTDWSSFDSTIDSYDPKTGTLKFANKLGYLISQKQEFGFYIFDSIKTLDKPGEWYKDKKGQLFYIPRSGEKPNQTRIAFKRRDFTFDVRGCSYVTIDGLTLEGGAVHMDEANTHIQFQNGRLFGYGKGGYGTYRLLGEHNSLESNEVYQVFQSAAVVSGSFHRIVNNYFHDITYRISQRSLPMTGHSHLVSYNTFHKFARNIVSVFPFRSEYSYNVFERAGMLSWDTAVFDGDVNGGDGGGCVIHRNVFRNSPTNGAYFAIYSGVDLVFHHNLIYEFGPEHRHHGSAQCMKFYHNTFVGADPQGLRIGSSEPFQSSYCNNIQLVDERVKTLGIEFRGNYNHGKRDFVDPKKGDFRLAKGSGAIDRGVVLPGINDGYRGEAPDAGAIEFGSKMWKVGHDFDRPPSISYRWKTIAGMNLEENGQFEEGAPSKWTSTAGEPRLFNGNTWNTLKRGLSPTGGRSYEIEPSEGLQRTFQVKPDTDYQLAVDCRLVGERIRLVDFEKAKGNIQKKKHRSEEYVYGLDNGEWLMFEDVEFGDETVKYDIAELLFSRHPRESTKADAASSSLELRVDSPDGPLLGTFRYRASVSESWYVSILDELKSISGRHNVYLIANGNKSGKMYLARLRFLKRKFRDEQTLSVTAIQNDQSIDISFVGKPFWRDDYQSFILKTGKTSTGLTISLQNNGDYNAYVDRFALVEVDSRRKVEFDVQPHESSSASVARYIGRPKRPQKVGQIQLGLTRQSGNDRCSVRVRAWTVPSSNDLNAPQNKKRFVFWEKVFECNWDVDDFDLVLKGTDRGNKRDVPLNSQPLGMLTVEISSGEQWLLRRLTAEGDSYTDLVRTDGQISEDGGTWSCEFTQSINIGEIRAWLPNSTTIPSTLVVLKDESGQTVWKKQFRKGQKVDWTRCLLLDGSTKATRGRMRLGSVLAKSLHISTPGLPQCAYRDIEVRDQAVAPPVKNLALRSQAIQSSDLYGEKSLASSANNALLQPHLDFTSTDLQKNPWLDLVLEKPSDVGQIVLYNRAGGSDERIGNFRVIATNSTGKTVWAEDFSFKRGDLANGRPLVINKLIRNVAKIRIQIKGKNYLHLAEVFIWGK